MSISRFFLNSRKSGPAVEKKTGSIPPPARPPVKGVFLQNGDHNRGTSFRRRAPAGGSFSPGFLVGKLLLGATRLLGRGTTLPGRAAFPGSRLDLQSGPSTGSGEHPCYRDQRQDDYRISPGRPDEAGRVWRRAQPLRLEPFLGHCFQFN